MTTLQTKPYALHPGQGQRLQSPDSSVLVKATSLQTSGAFNLFSVTCLPGYATPLHIHYAEDVVVYVLRGSLTFFWGGEKSDGPAGSYFFTPRGTPHGFRVSGSAPARILYLTIPAGVDRFVLDQELLAPTLESASAAAGYKIEIIGPLPD